MDKLWAHSVKVGAQAAILAKDHPRLSPEVALVSGLVHDIGYIPLLIKACEYPDLTSNPDYLDRLLMKLHPQLGSSIVKLWKFDPMVVAVASEHEDLTRDPGDAPVDYVDLVQVANIMAHEGTDHPLSGIDKGSIKAFARVGSQATEQEELMMEEDTRAVEDILF